MLLISCAAIPESIVKLRTGQDVAGVAVGFVGQDIASFGLLNLDILYIFLDDVAEKFGSGIRFRTEQDTAEKFFSSPRIRVAVKMLLSVMIVPPSDLRYFYRQAKFGSRVAKDILPKRFPFLILISSLNQTRFEFSYNFRVSGNRKRGIILVVDIPPGRKVFGSSLLASW